MINSYFKYLWQHDAKLYCCCGGAFKSGKNGNSQTPQAFTLLPAGNRHIF